MKIRKKERSASIIMGIFAAGLSLTGCQLAREDAGADSRDRLAGVLVTREYLDLFDMEGYLGDHAEEIMKSGTVNLEGNAGRYEGRLYGKPEGDGYVFEGADGMVLMEAARTGADGAVYWDACGDDGFSDVHSSVAVGDGEETHKLEGTVYVAAEREEESSVYYINPVYQAGDGSVYVTTGQGVGTTWSGEEGVELSQSLSDTVSITEKGTETKETVTLDISIVSMYAPQKIRILQMDGESNCISREEYEPGRVPEELTPERETAYLIVEAEKRDFQGKLLVSRTISGPTDETLRTYYAREDGICVARETALHW